MTTPEMIPEAVPIAMSVAIRIRFFLFFLCFFAISTSFLIIIISYGVPHVNVFYGNKKKRETKNASLIISTPPHQYSGSRDRRKRCKIGSSKTHADAGQQNYSSHIHLISGYTGGSPSTLFRSDAPSCRSLCRC